MRRTKLITFLLAACMVLSLCVPAMAAGTVLRVEQPEKLPAVGESFTVTVSIEENPGICAVQISLLYDKDVVKCTEIEDGKVLSYMMTAANPEAFDGTPQAIVAAAAEKEIKIDSTLALFHFEVLKVGDPAFALGELWVANEEDKEIPYTIEGLETVKPEEEPEIEEEGKPEEEKEPSKDQTFTDVPSTHWAYENVNRAAELGLIKGYADGSFGPERNMSRAEFVTVLWRMSGSPEPEKKADFSDVRESDWYAKQIAWASEQGYVNGADGKFNPNGVITREQVMSILFRYAGGQSGMESMFTDVYDKQFTDSGSISSWARPAVYWSIYQEIVGGMTETTIVPQGNATRAQISTIFLRYLDNIETEEE